MATFLTLRSTIETYIFNNVSSYPVIYENSSQTAPEDATWIRAGVRPYGIINDVLGTTGYDKASGEVYFNIFIPKGKGTQDYYAILNELKGLFFTNYVLDNIRFRNMSSDVVGYDEEDAYLICYISIPFEYRE